MWDSKIRKNATHSWAMDKIFLSTEQWRCKVTFCILWKSFARASKQILWLAGFCVMEKVVYRWQIPEMQFTCCTHIVNERASHYGDIQLVYMKSRNLIICNREGESFSSHIQSQHISVISTWITIPDISLYVDRISEAMRRLRFKGWGTKKLNFIFKIFCDIFLRRIQT